MTLSYLQKGITWFPEYILDLRSEHGAELIFSAVVKNDLIDLEKYHSVPGRRRAACSDGEISPLVVFTEEEKDLLYMLRHRKTFGLSMAWERVPSPSLRVYSMPSISLKKGTRIVLPLFHGTIRTEPIYCLNFSQSGFGGDYSDLPVWKGYRLFNDSSRRFWVEGQAMITSDNIPLGLRRFPYIPPQGSGEILVQTDGSIRARVEEESSNGPAGPSLSVGRNICWSRYGERLSWIITRRKR